MEVLLTVIAALFATLALCGFGLLLLGIVSTVLATVLSGLMETGSWIWRHVRGVASGAERGILALEGLASRPARRLRSEIARVLRLAPRDTAPRACACVKEVDGAFVGVLRVFNTQGHYLLRAPGGDAIAVARQLSTTLAGLGDHFPAEAGTPRADCPECDPATCPLRERGIEGPFAPSAA